VTLMVPKVVRKIHLVVIALLVGILVACSPPDQPIQLRPSITEATSSTPIRMPALDLALPQSPSPANTSAPTASGTPSQILEPSLPTGTLTSTPELLTCPNPGAPQADFAQQVWHWDEASQEVTQVPLPTEAVAPHISGDGRFAAYLIKGQVYDIPDDPLDEIPLWLFDLQSGQTRQVASFPISETRRQDPESPHIYLKIRWLEGNLEQPEGHWLLVEVYREPWAEAGCCVPGGDLYLVKAETGEYERILEAASYYFYNVRPDGRQIAALDMDGQLYLIDIPPAEEINPISVRLPANPWLVFAPLYSPDSAHMALQVESGLAVVDANSRNIQQLALENPCEGCYWGPRLPVIWGPDGRGFFTTTSMDDRFDQRAETTLIKVDLKAELKPETAAVIHANPFTFQFSPSFRYFSYWNQPEFDDIDAGEAEMNWVSLYLMDRQDLRSVLYGEEFGLRVSSWSPDSQHFLYTFSSVGGPNLDRRMFSLGNVCQPPRELPVPAGSIIDETKWLDVNHFLAWTLPADGIPDRDTSGLYLYRLGAENPPIHIDDILVVQTEPYGGLRQVVVLNYR
jgi:hypothetical protein